MENGLPRFQQGSTCPAVLRYLLTAHSNFVYRSITFYGLVFKRSSTIGLSQLCCRTYNPRGTEVSLVWAVPRSLTATDGISIDFSSSGYEDVSTPPVRSTYVVIGNYLLGSPIRKFPDQSLVIGSPRHIADILRPSSPLYAKASPVCS